MNSQNCALYSLNTNLQVQIALTVKNFKPNISLFSKSGGPWFPCVSWTVGKKIEIFMYNKGRYSNQGQ